MSKKLEIITANDLRGLKEKKASDELNKYIDTFIYHLYQAVIKHAEKSDEHMFSSSSEAISSFHKDPFMTEHKDIILDKLRVYFPDCLLEYRLFTFANNKWVDISTLNDEHLNLVNPKNNRMSIIVDWSVDN